MAQALINAIVRFFFFLVSLVGTIFFYPIQAILVTLIPNVGDFLVNVTDFFDNYIFNGIAFIKVAFCNITCCPTALFDLLISSILLHISIAISLRTFTLIYKVYMFIRGAKA